MAKRTKDDTRIFMLARTFTEEEHARAFLKGSVRMQTVAYFRDCEHTDKALRGDAYEGLGGIFQPNNIRELLIAGIPIPAHGLAGPLTFHSERVKHWHVFCLHAIGHTREDPTEFDSLEAMRRSILLHEDSTRLGKHVVFFRNTSAFLERLHKTLRKRGIVTESHLVTYYDDLLFTGFFDENEIPFRKSKRFAYQKEYRVVARTSKKTPTPLIVNIGDISDIAELTTAERFNDSIALNVNQKEPAAERCRHGEEPDDCERPCSTCGHTCRAHGRARAGCGDCDCSDWTHNPP